MHHSSLISQPAASPMDQETYRKEKPGALECVLIGMALADAPLTTRKQITEAVDGDKLIGERNGACLDAIREKDYNAVLGWLATHHGVIVRERETVVEAVIRTILRRNQDRRMAELIAEFTTFGGITATAAIRAILTDALTVCDEMDAIDATNTMEPVA